MQKIVAVWWPPTESQQGEISIEFELRAKIGSETDPTTRSMGGNDRSDPTHYDDATWASWRLKSLTVRLFQEFT